VLVINYISERINISRYCTQYMYAARDETVSGVDIYNLWHLAAREINRVRPRFYVNVNVTL
jgi:hypothetical protein